MKPLRVLIVEDSEQDAALLLRELQKAGYDAVHKRVETATEMTDALVQEHWDIVLSDYVLPNFSGLAAIKLVLKKDTDLPLIIISGQIGEDTAVEAMKAGAQDYIIKGNLKRLGPAIDRELAEAENRRRRKKAEEELEKYHANLEQLVKQRTSELEESRLLFKNLFDSPGAMRGVVEIIDDNTLRHIADNDVTASFVGLTAEALKGKLSSELGEPPDIIRVWVNHYRESERMGKPVTFEYLDQRGEQGAWLSATVNYLDISGGQQRFSYVAYDVTERKKAEQIKDEFIGMVSHELRTPLTVVIGALSTAMDERASKEQIEELVKEASSSAESLAAILDNMLELSRYQAGRLKLEKKVVRIGDVAGRAVDRVRRKYDTHDIIVEIPDDTPDISVDTIRIEQVLYNLIENAVKYSPQGSQIRIFSRQDKEGLIIGVSDRGVGISPADQNKLFEPFSRLQESGVKGIGLGLVVCKRLVEAHGGRIRVESQPGKGSTFLFSIP